MGRKRMVYNVPLTIEELISLRYHLSETTLIALQRREAFFRAGSKKDEMNRSLLKETRQQIRRIEKLVEKLENLDVEKIRQWV